MIFLTPCLSVPWPPLLCSYCSPPFSPFYFINIHNLSSGPCISLSGHLSLFSDHHMLVSSRNPQSSNPPGPPVLLIPLHSTLSLDVLSPLLTQFKFHDESFYQYLRVYSKSLTLFLIHHIYLAQPQPWMHKHFHLFWEAESEWSKNTATLARPTLQSRPWISSVPYAAQWSWCSTYMIRDRVGSRINSSGEQHSLSLLKTF